MGKGKKRDAEHEVDRAAVRNWETLSPSEREELASRCLESYPLTQKERDTFLLSRKRVDKILGIEKYRDARIVATIAASEACIAGHQVGDRIVFDSAGRLRVEEVGKPVCARLLNRAWYRLIMILDRMAEETEGALGDGTFEGEVIDVRMNCFGAPFPYGDCGQALMEFSVEGLE